MDEAWLWGILSGIAILLSGSMAALAQEKIDTSPQFGWWCFILTPLPLVVWNIAWVIMTGPSDNIRRPISIVVGAVAGAVILFGVCELLNKSVHAQVPPLPPEHKDGSMPDPSVPPPLINAPNNSGIVAPNNSGTITQNQGPPRLPLGLYQNGQPVGRVDAFSVNLGETEVTFTNPRLSGGMIDKDGSLDFQDYVVSCPQLLGKINRNAGTISIAVGGTVACQIIGTRR